MRRFRVSCLRVALVVVASFSAVSIGRADSIATLYTGSFPVSTNKRTVWQPWLAQVGGMLLGSTQTLEYSVTFTASITDFLVTPPCGPDCPRYFSGDLNSGSLSFSGVTSSGQDPYHFTGYITPGGSLFGEVFCDAFGCGWIESVFVNFVGQSPNGWQSVGDLNLDGGSDGPPPSGDSGWLDMVTTPVPEPNTMALFGAGIVALVGSLRRKLKR